MDAGSAESAQAENDRVQSQTQDEWIAEYEKNDQADGHVGGKGAESIQIQ